MHRIITGYLRTFCEENLVSDCLSEGKRFEQFANYCLIRSFYPEDFSVDAITSDEDDAGIDGICYIIDGEIAASIQEAAVLFNRPKRNIPVDIYFMQSKSGESYDRGEILKFGNGVADFVSDHPELPQGEFNIQQRHIFDLIIENVAKILNGRPSVHLRYVCTSNNAIAAEIEATRETIKKSIESTGFFNCIDFEFVGLEELIKLWDSTRNSITAIMPALQIAPYPEMQGISEAYVAIVPARTFVKEVLLDSELKMKMHIFEDNVRAYLGKDNPVNRQIEKTLKDQKLKDKFAIYNNGITIISPEVKVQNSKISLENYQIVNGCQTSNVLFQNFEHLTDDSTLTVKVIEAVDPDVIADVVRATNSQSKVDETQFLSFTSLIRRLERYFEATEDKPGTETKLYFERRIGQFKNIDIPKRRIFTITETCRAVGAMFFQKPELAYRYPTKMISDLYDKMVAEKNKEVIYYASAVALYRFKLLTSNGKIQNKYSIYKWHILMILPFIINEKSIPSIQNKKIESYSAKIVSVCSQPDDQCLEKFKKATEVLDAVGLKATRDEIRSELTRRQ